MGAARINFYAVHGLTETPPRPANSTGAYGIWVGMDAAASERRPSYRRCLRLCVSFSSPRTSKNAWRYYVPAEVYPLVVPGVLYGLWCA